MRIPAFILVSICLFLARTTAFSQDRCATHQVQKLQHRSSDADTEFEGWLKTKLRTSAQESHDGKRTHATYQIPVVVHVIHNGQNDITNIPDEQIFSQIRVLNEDFNRMNADASQTPSIFSSVAGSLDVEFVLAKQTPEGLPTNGIVRVKGSKTKWTIFDNYELKSESYWPAEDYLNIWVCNLEEYLGYAQFPQSTLINGNENSSTNRLTDGVVIVYDAFGSVDDGNFNLDARYNKGRTTTHEIGHFFGLRHISGDDDGECGNSGDYVNDTPDQGGQTYNCPSHPRTSCGVTSMFQNYLDYTNDACMNLFTKGQVDRMKIVMDNSPRRKTLLTSKGLSEPAPVANDLGIKAIISPGAGECATTVSPVIEIRNYGDNIITGATVQLLRGGQVLETRELELDLDPLETQTASFSDVTLTTGAETFSFEIIQTNDTADGNPGNDIKSIEVSVPESIGLPVFEAFEQLPANWWLQNADGLTTWEVANVPVGTNPNKAVMMNFFDYEDNEGELDIITTPLIDLSDAPVALLLFDVSHARYQGSNDGLKVVVIADCNGSVTSGDVIYSKFGSTLATRPDANTPFLPTSASHWRTEALDLSDYLGQKVQLAFVGVNDWGNNLYLDNVRVLTNAFVDLALTEVKAPSVATCDNEVQPQLVVRNSGTTISSFDVRYTINGETRVENIQMTLLAGTETQIALPSTTLDDGDNELTFTVENPDGLLDVNMTDNTRSFLSRVDHNQMPVPFRENFEDNYEASWSNINPSGGYLWQDKLIGDNNAIYHNGYGNPTVGEETWLVSPALDFSGVQEATLYFDLSYALRNSVSDILEVRASSGCGAPFTVLQQFSGASLTTKSSATPWTPKSATDWVQKSLDLTSLAGNNEVRLAFVLINSQGNNLYLDNLELFLDDELNRVKVDGLFLVYPTLVENNFTKTYISFNFPELQNVAVDITDNMGKSVYTSTHQQVLNQLYELPNQNLANGMYHVRVFAGGKVYASKLVVRR